MSTALPDVAMDKAPVSHTRRPPVNRQQVGRTVLWIIRLALGCLFVWSSLPKLRQPHDFLASVYDYQLLGAKTGMFVAITLPWLELLLGVCLIAGLFAGGALLCTSLLLAALVAAQVSVLWRGLSIGCACFQATGPSLVSYLTITRTGVMLLAAVVGVLLLLLTRRVTPAARTPEGR